MSARHTSIDSMKFVSKWLLNKPDIIKLHDAGWSSPVAREAHNLEVVGSNPAPATCRFSAKRAFRKLGAFLLDYQIQQVLRRTSRYRVRLRRARGTIHRANVSGSLPSHLLTAGVNAAHRDRKTLSNYGNQKLWVLVPKQPVG